jgi:hypothetical protein
MISFFISMDQMSDVKFRIVRSEMVINNNVALFFKFHVRIIDKNALMRYSKMSNNLLIESVA